jgi:hypothetical protein
MRQSEIVTNISKYLYGTKDGCKYNISEILGFCRGRDNDFINKLPVNKKFSTLIEFLNSVRVVYQKMNPENYDTSNVVVWVYIEQVALYPFFIGFNRKLSDVDWLEIRKIMKIDTIDIKDGQFAILNF